MNTDAGHIISLSEDKVCDFAIYYMLKCQVIKVWNARTMQCLQTLTDKRLHRPENIISSLNFDAVNLRLVLGHDTIEMYNVFRHLKNTATRSHDLPVVAALYNESFQQIVSGCQSGIIRVWNPISGDRTFQFSVETEAEMTAMTFDLTHRRMLTGSRDGVIRMYNFNNGQLLQLMKKTKRAEVTHICYMEVGRHRYIAAVGWDRRISLFPDEPGNFNTEPIREIHGENGSSRSHQDDIISMDFCPPSMVATAGIDGLILIWNVESNQCKAVLRDPFLDLRNQEERAVEKVAC
jgi:WD40 repeat protein